MAATHEIRRRIASTRNVAQMTRALQLVASAKLRHAQERLHASRPYAERLGMLFAPLAAQAEEPKDLPLLSERPCNRIGIVLVTPDRGKAGALSANINRHAAQLVLDLRRKHDNLSLHASFIAAGRKGREFLLRTRQPIIADYTDLGDVPTLADACAIARAASDAYLNEEMDRVFLVYPRLVSTLAQAPVAVRLLPVQPPETGEGGLASPYIVEPDAASMLAQLLPHYLQAQVYGSLLETVACYYSAQMVAMRNATDNATDLLEDLMLTYSKARQTAITTQILEIVGGAERQAP